MDRDDQLEVYKNEATDGAPIVDDSPPGVAAGSIIAAGTLTGRFRRGGRAATSEQGQLPGSEVPPRYASLQRDRHPTG